MSQATATRPSRTRPTSAEKYREGELARKIERTTAQLPSDAFLWTAAGVATASLALILSGRKHGALFLGQWVPSILICGLYNKVVKTSGHDQTSKEAGSSKRPDKGEE